MAFLYAEHTSFYKVEAGIKKDAIFYSLSIRVLPVKTSTQKLRTFYS